MLHTHIPLPPPPFFFESHNGIVVHSLNEHKETSLAGMCGRECFSWGRGGGGHLLIFFNIPTSVEEIRNGAINTLPLSSTPSQHGD